MVDVGNRVARNRAIEIMSVIFEWVPSPIALLVDGTSASDNEAENARSGNIYYPSFLQKKRVFFSFIMFTKLIFHEKHTYKLLQKLPI